MSDKIIEVTHELDLVADLINENGINLEEKNKIPSNDE